MNTGDEVRVKVAVNGGAVWKPGVIILSYPRQWNRRGYDVLCDDGVIIKCDEISLRAIKVAA